MWFCQWHKDCYIDPMKGEQICFKCLSKDYYYIMYAFNHFKTTTGHLVFPTNFNHITSLCTLLYAFSKLMKTMGTSFSSPNLYVNPLRKIYRFQPKRLSHTTSAFVMSFYSTTQSFMAWNVSFILWQIVQLWISPLFSFQKTSLQFLFPIRAYFIVRNPAPNTETKTSTSQFDFLVARWNSKFEIAGSRGYG